MNQEKQKTSRIELLSAVKEGELWPADHSSFESEQRRLGQELDQESIEECDKIVSRADGNHIVRIIELHNSQRCVLRWNSTSAISTPKLREYFNLTTAIRGNGEATFEDKSNQQSFWLHDVQGIRECFAQLLPLNLQPHRAHISEAIQEPNDRLIRFLLWRKYEAFCIPTEGLSFEKATELLENVSVALGLLSLTSVAHRDVKPTNFLRDNNRLILADPETVINPNLDYATRISQVGTPAYRFDHSKDQILSLDSFAFGKSYLELRIGTEAFRSLHPTESPVTFKAIESQLWEFVAGGKLAPFEVLWFSTILSPGHSNEVRNPRWDFLELKYLRKHSQRLSVDSIDNEEYLEWHKLRCGIREQQYREMQPSKDPADDFANLEVSTIKVEERFGATNPFDWKQLGDQLDEKIRQSDNEERASRWTTFRDTSPFYSDSLSALITSHGEHCTNSVGIHPDKRVPIHLMIVGAYDSNQSDQLPLQRFSNYISLLQDRAELKPFSNTISTKYSSVGTWEHLPNKQFPRLNMSSVIVSSYPSFPSWESSDPDAVDFFWHEAVSVDVFCILTNSKTDDGTVERLKAAFDMADHSSPWNQFNPRRLLVCHHGMARVLGEALELKTLVIRGASLCKLPSTNAEVDELLRVIENHSKRESNRIAALLSKASAASKCEIAATIFEERKYGVLDPRLLSCLQFFQSQLASDLDTGSLMRKMKVSHGSSLNPSQSKVMISLTCIVGFIAALVVYLFIMM